VVKVYVGTGPVAEATPQLDEDDRRRREEEAEVWEKERRRMEALIDELCDAAETLDRAALVAAGYRQHNRGEWRLSRGDGQR
jgi:hypothetical protein